MKKFISAVLAVFMGIMVFVPVYAASIERAPVKLCTFRSLGEFSPYLINDDVEYEAVRYIFDSLYYIDENDRSTEMMGHSLYISEDYKEYRITLRDDLYWHDGSKVTADDVIFTYTNAKNVEWFKACVRALDTVTAEGNTIVFRLKYADPVFMKEAVAYMPIVPKSYYEKGDYVSIGCGAYKLTEKTHGSKYVLEATDYYLAPANTSRIEIDVLPSEQDCVNAVKNAEYATVFGDLTTDSYNQFTDLQETVSIYGLTTKMLFLNNEILADSRLRKAIAVAIDYDRIVNEVYGEKAWKGAPGFFSTELGYSNKGLESYTNADEAKQMLTGGGYNLDGGVLRDANGNAVSINILTSHGKHEQMAGVVKDGMAAIGINAEITVTDDAKIMTEVKNGNYQAAIVHLDSYYQYCESNLNLLLSDEYANYSRYDSRRAKDALDRYMQAMDAYDRHDRLTELQSVIGEEAPFIALCYPDHLNGYEKGLYNMYAFKEGVGVYSVLSFVQNRKSVDAEINADVVNGSEEGNVLLAGGVLLAAIAVGFAAYFVMNKRKSDNGDDKNADDNADGGNDSGVEKDK